MQHRRELAIPIPESSIVELDPKVILERHSSELRDLCRFCKEDFLALLEEQESELAKFEFKGYSTL